MKGVGGALAGRVSDRRDDWGAPPRGSEREGVPDSCAGSALWLAAAAGPDIRRHRSDNWTRRSPVTYFCPECCTQVPSAVRTCPVCGADLASRDRESFDTKLMRALNQPEPQTAMRSVYILGAREVARAVPALIARCETTAEDSETRKQIYQDRETAELRTKAADVRRQIRLGPVPISADGATPAPSAPVAAGVTAPDLDALVAALTPEQRAALAAKLNAPKPVPAAPRAAPTRQAPRTMRPPALRNHRPFTNFRRAGDRTRTGDVQLGKLAFYH